jgi:HEAT repeat protein
VESTSLLSAAIVPTDENRPVLERALTSPVSRDRILALRGLTTLGVVTEEQWHVALADTDIEVTREALGLAARLAAPSPSVVATVRSLALHGDPLVADAAIFALGEYEDPESVELLLPIASSHEDPRCREIALASLGAIGDERAKATLIAALGDIPAVRRRAVVALANFEGADVDAALEQASTDRDWQVRSAVDQLGRD